MRDKLESKLVQNKWITSEQLFSALQESKRLGKSLWVALVKLKFLTQEDIAAFFAEESGIPYIEVSDYNISNEVLILVKEAFCRQNLIFPLFKIKDTLFIACVNPFNTTMLDELKVETGYNIEPLITSAYSLVKAQDYYYGVEERNFGIEKFIFERKPMKSVSFYRASERLSLKLSFSLYIIDKDWLVNCPVPIEGETKDISGNGTAMGLYLKFFIPPGVKVELKFNLSEDGSSGTELRFKGEVVYCLMENNHRYFLGINFLDINPSLSHHLLKLTE